MNFSRFIPQHISFALRFFFPPFLTFILGNILFELLAFSFLRLNQTLIYNLPSIDAISAGVKLHEIKARLLWATSVMLYFFIIIRFTLFIWTTLKTSVTKSTLLFFILLASVIFLVEIVYLATVSPSESPIASIFHFTFTTLATSGLFTATQLATLQHTLDIINITALLITPFSIVTGCCIMHRIPSTLLKKPAYFLNRSKQLNKLIAFSSITMVIGIIHMQLWLSWPLSLVPESSQITQLHAVILITCQYWGIFYSLVIASLYFPTANYLSHHATLALLQSNDETLRRDPSVWLKKNNMQFSLSSPSISQIITIIAPMLVGSSGNILSQLTQ